MHLGTDDLSMEFCFTFWGTFRGTSMNQECLANGEMITTMEHGVTSWIPTPDKDPLFIDNWKMIILSTDYKLITLAYANRLKSGQNPLINEIVLDLIDYTDLIDSEAIVLFLHFFKAFDTIEHKWLIHFCTLLVSGLALSL